ncbi:hypothetical protein L1S34_01220 [Flavobacterium sp. K77]|uniref:Bacterial Pleckstrin homology domain-containing protein n=1 Tax=Flavobacterium turcicum TaxID=2764718 RepID=A0ABR7JCC0_9FLAO|nr:MULTISPECIES: hypothetical protein [Flavobacterium]MBC5862117.1 hypothetical protein [Flavobacterium turcicum]MCF6139899.1 hypothetical protein [Flavobacterium sp. K77]NHL00848.1 hypothetical protein [Flavobacterium turcicum]
MILQITLWNQFKLLSLLLMITSSYIGLLAYAEIPFEKRAILIFSLPYLILFLIPVGIIHLNHYVNSKGIIYKIDETGITKIVKNEEEFISRANIKEITFFMTPNRFLNSSTGNFPFEDYYYAEIKTTDKKVLFISCFYSTKIDKILEVNFKELNIKKLKTIYPLINA